MYFSLTIVLLAVAVEQAFAESQSPFAQQPQHYSVVQTDSKFPKDLQLQYPTQQTFNEIDSNSPTNQKVNNNVQAKENTNGYDTDSYASSDPIQQYVAYGPENANIANAGTAAAAAGVVPVYSGYGNFGPYVYTNNPGAFAVQSGYEGYLVPGPPSQAVATVEADEGESNPLAGLFNFIPSPRTIVQTVSRAMGVILGLLGVTVMGGGLTTAICTYTPLCTITFAALPIRAAAKTVGEALDVDKNTVERLSRAASFVQTAVEKFQKMQDTAEKNESPTNEAETNKTEE